MNPVSDRRHGFTLVELLLAMSFVSVLLLAIALTIMQVGSAYNRGMTVKETNQAARGIIEDVRYAVTEAQTFSLEDDSLLAVKAGSINVGGRLCLGSYSYIWNYGRAATLNERTRFTTAPAGGSQEVHLVKVSDPAKSYCAKNATGDKPLLTAIRTEDTASARELLKVGDRTLSLSRFSVTSAAAMSDDLTGQKLYSFEFIIASGQMSAMNSNQSACLPPGNINADTAYCVVQQFSGVIRAGNKVN